MNINLEGSSFKKSWQGEIGKKFAKLDDARRI
jgi:hypothetical protein